MLVWLAMLLHKSFSALVLNIQLWQTKTEQTRSQHRKEQTNAVLDLLQATEGCLAPGLDVMNDQQEPTATTMVCNARCV